MKEYGSVNYENQEYKTVAIGTQIWMAANLNYNPNTGKHKCYAEGKGNNEDSWLTPEAAKANCDKYGRLYDWSTAMSLSANCNNSSCASQIQNPHKGICPNGWHIPSKDDWETLRKFIEEEIFENWEDEDFGWGVGTKLKAIAGWKETSTADKGVDSYGFGAIGTGYCVSCEELSSAAGFYSGEKEEAHWWSSTEYINKNVTPNDATKAYKSKITYNKIVLTQETEKKADYLYSVRCIKN
jgi:uncharacterized protein (TIGR02145 family)